MDISWKVKPWDTDADTIVILSREDTKSKIADDPEMSEIVSWLKASPAWEEFKGEKNQVICAYASGEAPFKKAILVGLGKIEDFNRDNLYSQWSAAFQRAKDSGCEKPAISMANFDILSENGVSLLKEFLFTGISSLYEYKKYKTKNQDSSKVIKEVILLLDCDPDMAILDAVSYLKALQAAITTSRNLINAPSNEVTPKKMVEEARSLAEKYSFTITVITEEEAEKMGMGAFFAVSKGSNNEGYIVVIEYCPRGCEGERPLVFVGKGITFDTGGISIKPASGMELMKHDMAGAATVLGVMEAVGIMKPPRRVAAVLPCSENMPDGRAYRPGDILKTLSGQTVEVISTDAEGRLILCDAITYAIQRFSPSLLVDLATLTGACIVALGDRVAGIMGNSEEVVKMVSSLGETVGEKMWPLPLYDFYAEDIKSDVADFKNVGNRKAGAVIGGIFLKQFVPDETPWVHIDIAGPAWAEKNWFHMPKGATGFGIRTLIELIKTWKID